MVEQIKPDEVLKKASVELRRLVEKILRLEKESLFENTPRGVVDEIVRIFKDEVK